MSRKFCTAAASVILLIACDTITAQTDGPQIKSDAGSVVDAVEADYRELICARAADTSNAQQDQAISLAIRQNYVDTRFNAIIEQSMRNASRPERWNVEELFRAVKLLPLCTLSPQEQAELVFRCHLECSDSKPDRSLRSQLKRVLERFPDQTSRLVHERLREGDDPKGVLPLLDIVGSFTEASLPKLMELAKDDDPDVAAWTMDLIPELIEQVRKLNQRTRQLAEQSELGLDGLDPKMVEYAKRIISRYDSDRDSKLSPSEYEKMLVSPVVADADNDGLISLGEYATWMQARGKRKQ